MGLISKNYTFSAGEVIVAAEHNSNFDTLYNCINGNLSNVNIITGAGITDDKLDQIVTSGKVSGASFTSLSSIPALAGEIPAANVADIPLTTGVTGILPIANGGTGTTSGISGILGSFSSKSASTIYQATTDGFLIGSTRTDDGAYYEIRTDSSATPTTVRMRMGGTGSTTTDTYSAFCCPIKKNDYYRIIAQGSGDFQSLDYCFFIPLGS